MALMSDFKSSVFISVFFKFQIHFILLSTGPSQTSSNQRVQTCVELRFHFQRLSDDFSRLLDEEILPDATLTCGEKYWRVHKSILTARSNVFAEMLKSGLSGSEKDVIRVEDMQPTVLDSLLKYVYSGKLPDMSNQENVYDLYDAADRYDLTGLKEALSNWMAEHLSSVNCLSVLVEAERHGDAKLKDSAVSFILEHFAEIERTSWTVVCMEHSLLAIEVLQHFAPTMRN